MTWAAIIPSRNPWSLLACIKSLRANHPNMAPDQFIVVSDGLPPWVLEGLDVAGAKWVEGKRPFVFAEAINAGARAAGDADLLICGDDVRFVTPGMIDRLQARSDGCAAVAPEVSGVCGQSAQREGSGRFVAEWLAFICIYIPRCVWDSVDGLDERFVGYGYDDVDWCARARKYGQLFVDHGSRVIHADCSTYRTRPDWQTLYTQNAAIFREKWRGVSA